MAFKAEQGQIRHSALITSLVEPVLLWLLSKNACHGYTLNNNLISLGINTINPSVVYRVLRDMEALGWIQSTWSADQTQGPPRRLYELTNIGSTILENWKADLIKIQSVIDNLVEKNQQGKEQ